MMVAQLAVSRVRDRTDALPDLRPPGRLDGPARPLGSIKRRRTAGAPPRGLGLAAAESQTETGLGRPGSDRGLGPAAPSVTADEPASHARDAAALAPAAGPVAVDVSLRGRPADSRRQGRGADRADGAGEPGWGYRR